MLIYCNFSEMTSWTFLTASPTKDAPPLSSSDVKIIVIIIIRVLIYKGGIQKGPFFSLLLRNRPGTPPPRIPVEK